MKPFFGITFVVLLLAAVWVGVAAAQDPQPTPSDNDVNAVAKQLFCPVCENTPLDVCPTQACAQWRELIREKMELGWSEAQIKVFFAEQYGDQVLALPPRRGFNWLIYVLPPLIVIIGVVIVARVIGKSKKRPVVADQVDTPVKPAAPNDVLNEIEQDLRREE